jgi:hypothetical protein
LKHSGADSAANPEGNSTGVFTPIRDMHPASPAAAVGPGCPLNGR